ncbi:glycosyltransferase [Kitasatospora sp. NBC_01560]|uniref:glycosyltransferase n=1 Tax=Kitasatospora sp. NBC_01560 TaxID=2975965 RepID=UPI003870AF8B
MIPVDTASFRPRALRADERGRIIARAVASPSQRAGGGAWRGDDVAPSSGLRTLWTKEAQLRPIIVAVITEDEQQILPDLLDAFSQVKPRLPEPLAPVLLLWAAGGGTQPDWHARGDVVFAPERDPDERPFLLAAADLFLAASPEATEAVYQAMATALPVIGTTGGSLGKEISSGGYDANGWLADPGDADALANAIVQACLYRPERLRRGTAAAEHVRNLARRPETDQMLLRDASDPGTQDQQPSEAGWLRQFPMDAA